MLQLMALDHVGLTVTNFEETLDFYQRLGLTLLRTSGPNADGLRSAVLRVGSQELNVFSRPALVASARTTRRSIVAAQEASVGMDHFCFMVDAASIDDVVADLRQAGIDIAKGPEKRRDGMALFVHDPDGVRVELQIRQPVAQE